MGLIAKTKLKIPSGLTIVQKDYPSSAHTVTEAKPTSPDQESEFLESHVQHTLDQFTYIQG